VSKKDLEQDLREARAEFMAAIEGLTPDEMLQPGAAGYWSVKDIMAHLIAWEAEVITALSRKLSKPYKDAPNIVKIEDIDEWNMEQYHEHAQRPYDAVLPDFEGVHKHLLLALNDLEESVLDKPARFDWMEGEPLSYLVLETAVWHEREHAEDIKAWREQRCGG
jgi:hypothetical protein